MDVHEKDATEENLCMLWEAHPQLYDTNCKQYKQPGTRHKAIQYIAMELELSEDEVRTRMSSLRTWYRKIIKKGPNTKRQRTILRRCSFLKKYLRGGKFILQSSSSASTSSASSPSLKPRPRRSPNVVVGQKTRNKYRPAAAVGRRPPPETPPSSSTDARSRSPSPPPAVTRARDEAADDTDTVVSIQPEARQLWTSLLHLQMDRMSGAVRDRFMTHIQGLAVDAIHGQWPDSKVILNPGNLKRL